MCVYVVANTRAPIFRLISIWLLWPRQQKDAATAAEWEYRDRGSSACIIQASENSLSLFFPLSLSLSPLLFLSFSIVIDGERGNRPRIYSLEQLLQEAVSSEAFIVFS